MAVTRAINFSDEDYEKLREIKKMYNLKSDSATFCLEKENCLIR